MNERLVKQAIRQLEGEKTDILLKTWADCDGKEWPKEVFAAVHRILVARGESPTPGHEFPGFVEDDDDILLWERIPLLLLTLASFHASYWSISLMVIPLGAAGLLAGCASVYTLWVTGGFCNWRHRTDNEVFPILLVYLQIPWTCLAVFLHWMSLV